MVPARRERVVKQEKVRAPAGGKVKTPRTRLDVAVAGVPARVKASAVEAEGKAEQPAGGGKHPQVAESYQQASSLAVMHS